MSLRHTGYWPWHYWWWEIKLLSSWNSVTFNIFRNYFFERWAILSTGMAALMSLFSKKKKKSVSNFTYSSSPSISLVLSGFFKKKKLEAGMSSAFPAPCGTYVAVHKFCSKQWLHREFKGEGNCTEEMWPRIREDCRESGRHKIVIVKGHCSWAKFWFQVLVVLVDDLCLQMGEGNASPLLSLDLSEALDLVECAVLLRWLEGGLGRSVLRWL